MSDLGFLNFGIGIGEDLLAKALEKNKQEALDVQNILKSMNILGSNTGMDATMIKIRQAADKATLSSVKLGEAMEKSAATSLIGEQKLQTEMERTAAIREKSAAEILSIEKRAADNSVLSQKKIATEAEKAAAVRSAASDKTLSNEARIFAMVKERQAKQSLWQQKQLTEIERTNAARLRGMKISHDGQVSFNNAAGLTNKTLFSQKNLLNQISNAAGIYFSIYQVGAFVRNLAMVSGEFEMQKISLENILQNADAANKIFGQIKSLSVVSPFEFKDLVGYSKQLSAFSIPINELYDTTKRLADVSAGLGVDMGRIILAYGQIRSASVLRGQELRQLTEAGIPIIDELIKKFAELGETVSAGQVFDKISDRMVPFSMIKDIFTDMTSEGGKFFEMQERQSESLKGKIANLKDAYDIMLYSIGQANDGMLKGGVETATDMMKNWESVAAILKEIIITYGVYRASLIAVAVAEKSFAAWQSTNKLLMASTIIQGSKLTAVLDMLSSKFDKISKTQWWALALAAVAALGYGIYSAYQNAHKLDNELSDIINKSKSEAEASIVTLDNLVLRIQNTTKGSQKYSTAISELNRRYGEYLPKLITESDSLADIESKLKNVTAAIYEKAKAQSYSQSVDKIEEELSSRISQAHDSAIQSLTKKGFAGYGQLVLSKEDANKLVANIFSQIKSSPELYKGEEAVRKLIGDSMSKAFSGIKGIKIESFYDVRQFGQLNGLVSGVYEYADAISSLSEKQQAAYDKSIALYGETENYVSEIEKVNVKYSGLEIGINKKVYADSENGKSTQRNTDLFEMQKTKLLELIGVYKKFGQLELAKGVQSQFDILIQSGQKWVVTAKEIVGENKSMLSYSPQDNERIFDYADRLRSAYKGLKEQQKQIEGGLLAPDISKEAIPEQIKGIESLASALGFLLNTGKEEKDPRVEPLQKEIALIKEAYSEYVKLKKVMSEPMAMRKIKEQERYKKVDVPVDEFGMANKNKEYADRLIDLNSKDGKSAAEAFNKSYTSDILAIDTDTIDKFMKKVGDEIDKFKDGYDFYEKLLGTGEDKRTAIKIAFGVDFDEKSLDVGKTLSEMLKKASRKVGIEMDFDFGKGGIIEQLGDTYQNLTPELKKQIDALEKYRSDKQKNAYLDYISFIEKETPEGTGVSFDLSKVLSKMRREVSGINAEFEKISINATPGINKSSLDKAKDEQIKSANAVAVNNAKNIGANFVEQSLKNKIMWEDFKNLGDASYGDIKKMIEEIGRLQKNTLSKDGISRMFSNAKLTGGESSEEDNNAFSPIMQMLGNAGSIEELGVMITSLLQNINDNKERGVDIDERMKGLTDGQINSLRIVLTAIENISSSLDIAAGKTKKIALKDQINAFKKLGDAATDVIDNVEGLGSAFGSEFDDITKGSLDVIKTIASSSIQVADTLTSFVDASGKSMSLSAMMAGDAIQKVEAASVILTIISAALKIAMAIANLFTGNKTKKADDAIEEQQNRIDNLQRSYDRLEKSAEKYYTLEADISRVSKWLEAEKAAIKSRYGYLKDFGERGKEFLNALYSDAEKRSETLKESSYLEMEKANMEQQRKALEEQIRIAEGDNKKGKRDDDIKGYKDQLEDLGDKMEETTDKWYETLRGFSMQDIADDFAEAWVDAFSKGEDAMDAMEKKFGEMVKNMIVKQAAMRVVSMTIKPLMDTIDKAIGEDGELDPNGVKDIMNMVPSVLRNIDKGMNEIIKPLLKEAGITFGSATEAGEGLSKGIAGVTEDTANLLASYINAIRADVSANRVYLQRVIDLLIPNSSQFALQVAELKKIEANTYRTANNTERNADLLNEVMVIFKSVTTQGSGKRINI